jgi:lysophospholipase L1-like esterase
MELKGKRIAFLGDSITEGVGVSDIANCRYDNVLLREMELAQVYNYGISGSRFAHQSVPSNPPRFDLCFCGRAYNISRDADIIVVYGGVNDYIHGDAPVGTPEDKTPATFWGATYFLMNLLKTEYADKTVVFMTPARGFIGGTTDTVPSPNPNKKPDAMPLLSYVEIIKECARQMDIPVLDLYHELGIDPNNADERLKYTVDGLHFNDAGQAVLAKRLGDFLKSL